LVNIPPHDSHTSLKNICSDQEKEDFSSLETLKIIKSMATPANISVVAPMDLLAGVIFDVKVDGKKISVLVVREYIIC